MSNLVFADSATLQEILQDKIAALTFDDPLFAMFPLDRDDTNTLMWEQRDNWQGLTAARAFDGGFGRVQREGFNRYTVIPGAYGDQKVLSEEYLTTSREIGEFGTAIDITKGQALDQEHLLARMVARVKKIVMDLLVNGNYSVPGPNGATIITDTFSLQSFTASVSWATAATSTPLADMRTMKLKSRGHSVRFNAKAELWINSKTVNNMLANTNANDLGGRRTVNASGQIQPLSLEIVNQIMMDNDLPRIVEYDDGYMDDSNVFQLFIPDNAGVLIGARTTGEPVGKFVFTRNVNNHAMGRGSTEVYFDFEFKKNPVKGISTLSFNGAPAIWFPSAIVKAAL